MKAAKNTPFPMLPFPLRSDPKPRAVWPDGLTHLPDGQWPLGLPVSPPSRITVDSYLDGAKRRSK